MKFSYLLLSLSLGSMLIAPRVNAVEPISDHSLVNPYEGSQLRRKNIQEYDEYNAFLGMDESGEKPIDLELKGKVTKLVYSQPKDRSILEVYTNYQQALEQAGANILYQCNKDWRKLKLLHCKQSQK